MRPHGISEPATFETPAVRTFRHIYLCLFWAAATLACAAFTAAAGTGGAFYAGFITLAYAAQAMIAEALGVSVRPDMVYVPRRPTSSTPLLILWRPKIAPTGIHYLTLLPPSVVGERVRIRSSASRLSLFFRNREQRRAFFDAVRRVNARIEIYKGR